MDHSLQDMLNKQIANWGLLYIKLHNYHWLVKGGDFYELHEKFEEFYDEAAKNLDEIAERLLALNGRPFGTMKEYLQNASLNEATGNESSDQMVKEVVKDFETIVGEIKEATQKAEEQGDQPTGDMFNHIRFRLEKNIWMLKSFLNE